MAGHGQHAQGCRCTHSLSSPGWDGLVRLFLLMTCLSWFNMTLSYMCCTHPPAEMQTIKVTLFSCLKSVALNGPELELRVHVLAPCVNSSMKLIQQVSGLILIQPCKPVGSRMIPRSSSYLTIKATCIICFVFFFLPADTVWNPMTRSWQMRSTKRCKWLPRSDALLG